LNNQPHDSDKDPTLRTAWLPHVRVSPLELARIRELYGPTDFSENVRIRLLQKRPGRPRRILTQVDPKVAHAVQLCLVALESLRNSLSGSLSADGTGLTIATLAAIEEHLKQTLHAYKISKDDSGLPHGRKNK